jgi:hypothetical protein
MDEASDVSVRKQPDVAVKPQIGISHIEAIPNSFFDEFAKEIASNEIELQMRTHGSVFGAMEWLMPTVIILYISRKYIDAILSEAGKDHYIILKNGVTKLYRRAASLRVWGLGKRGKLPQEPAFSLNFSIMADVADYVTMKFLIHNNISEDDAEKALKAFLELVQSMADLSTDPKTLKCLADGKAVGRTLLLAYDFEQGKIVIVNPLHQKGSKGQIDSKKANA